MSKGLQALRDVDFNWVRSLESIWSDADVNVEGPNEALADRIVSEFIRETGSTARQPNGKALVGPAGIGKTHIVGRLRPKVWSSGGWFVLLDVLGLTDFWRSAALSFLTSMLQEMPDGSRQFEAVLAGVARRFNAEKEVEAAFNAPNIEPRKIVDLLIKGLMKTDMTNTLQHRD